MGHPRCLRNIYTGCYTDWVWTLVTTISCLLWQSNGSLTCSFAGAVTASVHNEGGRYIYSPSLNDKNDKESEKSPMRVIGRGLWKPCHCCHSCHGRCVGRSLTCPPATPHIHALYDSRRVTDRCWLCTASTGAAALPSSLAWVLQRLCVLALLVWGKWGIEMPQRNLLVMERTYISLSLSVWG